MDQQIRQWKFDLDRFWSSASPDHRGIAQLVAEIAGTSADETLRQAASQALPSLRNAAAKSAGRSVTEVARRRLSIVRDALHTLVAPRFGKRGVPPKALTPEEHHRQTLGLPFGRIHDPLGEGVWRCLCVAEHALEQGRLAAFVNLTARAIWGEGADVSRDAPLRTLCERAGLEWDACRRAIASPDYRERVETNTAQLAALGHWGVPTLVFEGEAYWGQDRIEDLERRHDLAGRERRARVAAAPQSDQGKSQGRRHPLRDAVHDQRQTRRADVLALQHRRLTPRNRPLPGVRAPAQRRGQLRRQLDGRAQGRRAQQAPRHA